jgi:C-terminal processing protease CtpA/Prc
LIGYEVLTVDKLPVLDIVAKLVESEWGSSSRKRKVAISKVLMNESEDSTLIVVRSPEGKIKHATVLYDEEVKIPKIYRHESFEFEIIDNCIVLVRFENWEMSHILHFLNNWNVIKAAKGIIIDLRSNGGGSLEAASTMFSFFIDKPKLFCRNYTLIDHSGIESLFIKPNFNYSLPNTPVVILGNELTACASEMFILAMRQIDRAIFIGNITCGSLISASTVVLPSGIKVKTNAMFNKFHFTGHIEDVGIAPDIWVPLNEINDMSAYQDKVLLVAVTYINSF